MRKTLSLLTALFLTGCASLPEFELGTADHTADIVRHIECELNDAYKDVSAEHPWLRKDNWLAGYKLTYKADATTAGTVGPAVWMFPVKHSLTGQVLQQNQNIRQGVVEYKNEWGTIPCISDAGEERTVAFRGDLGIRDWLTKALEASSQTEEASKARDRSGKPDVLTYDVTFAATIDASMKPGFTLVNLTLGGTAGWKKIDTSTLSLAFTAPDKSAKKGGVATSSTTTNGQDLSAESRQLLHELLNPPASE